MRKKEQSKTEITSRRRRTGSVNGHVEQHGEIDLLLIAHSAVSRRRMILRNTMLALLVFVLLSLLLPRRYNAKALLLPPDTQEASPFTQLFEQTPIPGLTLLPSRSSSDLFVEILRSRAVGERVLHAGLVAGSDSTSLMRYWQLTSPTKALRRLQQQTTFTVTEQGMIEIDVALDDPHLAASVVQAYIVALNEINQEKNVSRAQATRKYIEAQLVETRARLRAASDSLAWYQAQKQAMALDEQARAVLEQAGQLKGELMGREVQLELLRQSMTADNPALLRAEKELAAMRQKFTQLTRGNTATADSSDALLTMTEMPLIARRTADLVREAKAQETVWQFLTQQYYQARIQEARDTPTVQVLDPPLAPEFASWPRPVLMTATGTLTVFLLSVLAAILSEVLRRQQLRPEERAEWRQLWLTLKSDFRRRR